MLFRGVGAVIYLVLNFENQAVVNPHLPAPERGLLSVSVSQWSDVSLFPTVPVTPLGAWLADGIVKLDGKASFLPPDP